MLDHQTTFAAVVDDLIGLGYLSPPPKRSGWRAWSMAIPAALQFIGLTAMGWVAWSLTEAGAVSDSARAAFVIGGAGFVTVGGNIGSLPVAVECFRGGLSRRDLITLIISTAASFVETLAALSFLAGFAVEQSQWRIWLMAALAVGDTTFGVTQLAKYLDGHEERMAGWHAKREAAIEAYYDRQDNQQWQEPTPEQREAKPLPAPQGKPEDNGRGKLCWCDENYTSYGAHHRWHHLGELYPPLVKKCNTAEELYALLASEFAATWDTADHAPPTAGELAELFPEEQEIAF